MILSARVYGEFLGLPGHGDGFTCGCCTFLSFATASSPEKKRLVGWRLGHRSADPGVTMRSCISLVTDEHRPQIDDPLLNLIAPRGGFHCSRIRSVDNRRAGA